MGISEVLCHQSRLADNLFTWEISMHNPRLSYSDNIKITKAQHQSWQGATSKLVSDSGGLSIQNRLKKSYHPAETAQN